MPERSLSEEISTSPFSKDMTETNSLKRNLSSPTKEYSQSVAYDTVEGRHPHDNDEGGNGDMATYILEGVKTHFDRAFSEMKEQHQKDIENLVAVIQQETTKRMSLEQRLHSQLLLQSETMVAMELKLLRLEAKVERREAAQRRISTSRSTFQTIDEDSGYNDHPTSSLRHLVKPTMVLTSGASLASGISGDVDVDVENEETMSQQSTPTLGSRATNPIAGGNLDTILLAPVQDETVDPQSYHATRIGGVIDPSSNIMMNTATITTTTTNTTRGDTGSRGRQQSRFDMENRRDSFSNLSNHQMNQADIVETAQARPLVAAVARSRSNSPSTVQSYRSTTDGQSIGSAASQSTAIMSSVAVATPRTRRAWRGETAPDSTSRPLANRVVSFTTTDLLPPHHHQQQQLQQQQQHQQQGQGQGQQAGQNQIGNNFESCDSITVPDELDNLSEVADAFASSSKAWREEYEARLDALQKRMATE